jgi:polysaccharide export outer membrane protein
MKGLSKVIAGIFAVGVWVTFAHAAELEIVPKEEAPAEKAAESVDDKTGLRESDMALLKEALGENASVRDDVVIVKDEDAAVAGPRNKEVRPLPPDALKTVAKTATDEPTRYTLGPDDVIEIIVRRHPEFSDKYPINSEGKIQYKFVGDIEIKGLTKTEVKDLVIKILAKYVISPEVDVTILEYRSKVIYVIGEVGSPGKYYMKADKILMREAVVQAGLPTLSAAMRRTTLIRPDKSGKPQQSMIDLYALLYEGKLDLDREMFPGDVLVVPATLFAKIFRVINPVANTVSTAKDVATPY